MGPNHRNKAQIQEREIIERGKTRGGRGYVNWLITSCPLLRRPMGELSD